MALARSAARLVALLVLLPLIASCTVLHDSSYPLERRVEFDLDPKAALDLAVIGDLTDVVVIGQSDRPRVTALLRERVEHAGQLVCEPTSGDAKAAFSLHYRAKDDPNGGFADSIELHLPPNVAYLSVMASVGDVEIRDLTATGDVRVRTDVGDVVIERSTIDGTLDVEADVGDIGLHDLRGALIVRTSVGDVFVERVESASVDVENEVGDIVVVACPSTTGIRFATEIGSVDVSRMYEEAAPRAPRQVLY